MTLTCIVSSACVLAYPVPGNGLWSSLSITGDSRFSDDETTGSVGVNADGLVFREHSLNVNFDRNSRAREGAARESLSARYSFPLQGNFFSVSARNNSRYSDQISSSQRQKVHVLSDETRFSARRALHSWHGLEFDSELNHRAHESRRTEQGNWTETTAGQLSTLGLSGKTQVIQLYGWDAATMVTFSRGLVVSSRQAPGKNDTRDADHFYKILVGGSLGRELSNWHFGLSGRYQVGTDHLPAGEQIRVAGPQLLTGFQGSSYTAASGGWFRLDADTPGFDVPFIDGMRAGARLSLVRGWADVRVDGNERYLNADAGELSLQLRTRYVRASTSIGRVLGHSPLLPNAATSPNVRLSLSVEI